MWVLSGPPCGTVANEGAQIEEVKLVTQVLDQEEVVAIAEFEKFEEKLKKAKGPEADAVPVAKP